MEKRKLSCWVFALLAALLAGGIGIICITQRQASPKMLVQPEGARRCVQAMVESINAGDISGASAYLYGKPKWDVRQHSTQVAQQIWEAFAASMECTPVGDCYASIWGVSQDVTFRSLEIPGMTASLKEQAQTLLESRINRADSIQEVYDENREYRPEFLEQVIGEAAQAAISGGTIQERQLTLNLVFDEGRWWIVPDSALLEAISGGILM